MAFKKHTYREGDKIEIINPIFIQRVGYPKTPADYMDVVSREDIAEFLSKYYNGPSDWDIDHLTLGGAHITISHNRREITQIQQRIAYLMARLDGFGGRQRSLHTVELPYYKGRQATVIDKRIARTGEYYGPHGEYCSFNMEYNYEPGGLDNVRSHVILELNLTPMQDFTPIRIEACNVRRIP